MLSTVDINQITWLQGSYQQAYYLTKRSASTDKLLDTLNNI